jgi:uncharacterized protein YndB with AHSA1/START domain
LPHRRPDGTGSPHTLDFRVGGRESSAGTIEGGPSYTYDAVYQDIVQDERIVSTYDMTLNGERISVSVATVEFAPEGSATRLTLTEQVEDDARLVFPGDLTTRPPFVRFS